MGSECKQFKANLSHIISSSPIQVVSKVNQQTISQARSKVRPKNPGMSSDLYMCLPSKLSAHRQAHTRHSCFQSEKKDWQYHIGKKKKTENKNNRSLKGRHIDNQPNKSRDKTYRTIVIKYLII